MHFAEGTAFPPLGVIVWHTLYRDDAAKYPEVIERARERAHGALNVVEQSLVGKKYLLGSDFSAADIMMGFTLGVARLFGVLDDSLPNLQAYMARLEERPAFKASVEM